MHAGEQQGGTITDELWRESLKRHAKSERCRRRFRALELSHSRRGDHQQAQGSVRIVAPRGVAAQARSAAAQGSLAVRATGTADIARTLANESGLPFLAASTADFKAGFIGQSGQKVREMFERARGRAPCILFIDEIDAIAPARGGGGDDQATTEIVNQLLQEMDGVKASDRHIFVLAATNRPEAIDDAVRSRLKDTIEIPNPDREQREKLFRLFIGNRKSDFDAAEMAADLARRTTISEDARSQRS